MKINFYHFENDHIVANRLDDEWSFRIKGGKTYEDIKESIDAFLAIKKYLEDLETE